MAGLYIKKGKMNADMLSFREIIIDGSMKDVKEDRKSKKKLHFLRYLSVLGRI
jgi:hypothetical protein